MALGAPSPYAVRLTVARPERQRRLTNFPLLVGTFIRLVLVAPSIAVLYYLLGVAIVAYVAATFVIMVRGRYPRGLFKLLAGVLRWQANVNAYLLHLYDPYPPLDLDQRPDRELQLEIDYPLQPSRWLNAPLFGLALKLLLCIPHLLILSALNFLASVVVFIAEFAILFSGRFPPGLHDLVVAYLRWNTRVSGYLAGFTDKYPPFSFA